MSRRIRTRWNSKFARFIQFYGVESLAVKIDIRPSAIYHWIRGATAPRPVHALTIQRLARERRFRLSMEEIYRHSRAIRENRIRREQVDALKSQ